MPHKGNYPSYSGKNAIAGGPHNMPLSGSESLKTAGKVNPGPDPGKLPPSKKNRWDQGPQRVVKGH